MLYQNLVDELGSVYEPNLFELNNIRYDLIDVAVEGYNIVGDYSALVDFFGFLRRYQLPDVPQSRLHSQHEAHLFSASQGGALGGNTISVRGGNNPRGQIAGQPLFGAFWQFRRGRSMNFGSDEFRGTVNFKLNPTRFFRNLIAIHSEQRQPPERVYTTDYMHLLSLKFPSNVRGEMTLDRSDNCLQGTGWHRYNSRFFEVAENYQRFCFGLFDNLLEASHAENHSIGYNTENKTYNLNSIEMYWEKASRNALADVQWLAKSLEGYGRTHQNFRYGTREGRRASAFGEGRLENSAFIFFPIQNGVKLKIYAKTDYRIRYEIKFELADCRNLIGGRKTTQDQQMLFDWMATLSNFAAEKMNEWCDRLVVRMDDPIVFEQLENFLDAVYSCNLSSPEKRHLLRSLVFNGCYVQQNEPRMRTALDRLKLT